MNPFVLLDVDCKLDPALLRDIAEASSIHVNQHFGREAPYGYGCGATVRVAASAADVQPGEIVVGYLSHPDVASALGYHDRTPQGHPLAKVFPLLDDPAMRGVTETHEIDEALADPELSSASVGADGVIRAREPGDPVETLSYPITVSSGRVVLVTNFVTPAYFEPPDDRTGVLFDYLGKVTAPGEILPGGYQLIYTPGVGWTQTVNGRKREYRQAMDVHGLSRNARRTAADTASTP